jgi:hypothetical protein
MLELDHSELGVFSEGLHVRLFENTPGGCGHLLELEQKSRAWFVGASEKLRGSQEHDALCRTACLSCILTSGTQFDLEAGRIRRVDALRYLTDLLAVNTVPDASASTDPVTTSIPVAASLQDSLAALRSKAKTRSRRKP